MEAVRGKAGAPGRITCRYLLVPDAIVDSTSPPRLNFLKNSVLHTAVHRAWHRPIRIVVIVKYGRWCSGPDLLRNALVGWVHRCVCAHLRFLSFGADRGRAPDAPEDSSRNSRPISFYETKMPRERRGRARGPDGSVVLIRRVQLIGTEKSQFSVFSPRAAAPPLRLFCLPISHLFFLATYSRSSSLENTIERTNSRTKIVTLIPVIFASV